MPRASMTKHSLHCTNCQKTLARHDAIKCPRCKTINPLAEMFAKEMSPDVWMTCFLWRPDGHSASSVCIRKEIWLNVSGRFPNIPSGELFPVFHVFNHLDPSMAYTPLSGCRVNSYEQPFTDLNEALALAQTCEEKALASGEWVRVEDLKN